MIKMATIMDGKFIILLLITLKRINFIDMIHYMIIV